MCTDVNFNDNEKKWIPLIGQFMLDFASIEDSIHHVIKFHVKNSLLDENDITDRLDQRIIVFEKIFTVFLSKDEDKSKLKSVVAQITNLKRIRNLIAHNSLSLTFEEKNGEMKLMGFYISSKKRDTFSINYNRFNKKVGELRDCRNELGELMTLKHAEEMKHMVDGTE